MNKRPGFIIIIFLFVSVIIGFYIYLKQQQSPDIDTISAVPVNVAILAEIKNPDSFLSEIVQNNRFFKELAELPGIDELNKNLKKVDSLTRENDKLTDLRKNKTFTFSLHEVGNKQFELLYLMHLSGRYEANQLLKQINMLVKGPAKISESKYNQVKVYTYVDPQSKFYYAYHRGILMGSKSEILLQNAIRQVESDVNIKSQEGFLILKETEGNHADANVYIHFEWFQKFYQKIITPSVLKEWGISQIGDWLELDLNLKNQTVLFSGFGNPSKNPENFYSLFEGQQPQSIKFQKFVPMGAESFAAFGISDLPKYQQKLQKLMESIGQEERFQINQQQLADALGDNYKRQLHEAFQKEIAQVTFADGSTLFFVKTKGYNQALELIQNWVNFYAENTKTSAKSLRHDYKIDKESHFPIYKFPIDYFPVRMFGPWFKSCKAEYVTAFDDYLIFGSSVRELSQVIYNNVLQKTLAYDGAYSQFGDYISSKVNGYTFVSLSGSGNFLSEFITPEAFNYYKANQSTIHDFYALSWQFSVENKMIYNNFIFRHQPSNKIKAATQWETRLDTALAFKPQLVVNHYTNEKEILVQDMKNTLYLINKAGRIIWRKKLDEPILGEINQIDYYKNGKLQYLFNTKSKIFMLDRNGNFVERYPIKLAAEAVNTLSIFDYDNRKNYRIFIPAKDKKVYCYDIEGKIVSGFRFAGTDEAIISPVQYVRNQNKDFILVTDVSRIYLLDRRGSLRIKLNKQFNPSKNNQFEYQPANSSRQGRLIRTDENGMIYYIYFDGKVESESVGEFSSEHYFKLEDVTGDKVSDFVFVDGKKMQVFSITGKKEFEQDFSTEIIDEPAFYKFSANQVAIGITETSARKIYLFDTSGECMEGFPLPGKTRFSIGVLEPGSGRFNLIVGGDEQYLYNFKLN